jgi:phenylacetic acid degradation operon negative regulatory protein
MTSRPGALVLDLLGDIRRSGGRTLRLKSLVELGEELGIPGPTMRVTLARLRERGWFDVRHEGRESIYTISSTAVENIHEAAQRMHQASVAPWSGNWSMVIYTVPESDRQTRDELRKQLMWLGFGPLAPATWIRPQGQLDDIAAATSHLKSAKLTLLTTRSTGLEADRNLVERCWDMDSLRQEYEAFVAWVTAKTPTYKEACEDPRQSLRHRIELVHAYREFGKRDPHLPAELQPTGWSGEKARELFEKAHSALSSKSGDLYAEMFI